jgi:type IV pilus assembly protein PilB
LLVWYHLAWMGETVRRNNTLIQHLMEKGRLSAERAVELHHLGWEDFIRDIAQELELSEQERLEIQSKVLNIPLMNPELHFVDPEAISLIPDRMARRYRALPIFYIEKKLFVVLEDPLDVETMDDLGFLTGMIVEPILIAPSDLDLLFLQHLDEVQLEEEEEDKEPESTEGDETSSGESDEAESPPVGQTLDDLLEADGEIEESSQVVQMVGLLLKQAILERVSDIHVEPSEYDLRIRFRIDGAMREKMRVPRDLMPAVLSRLKIMAKMDIAERRIPQDGQFTVTLREQGQVDFRVSSFPTVNGEKIVLRILIREQGQVALDDLGFDPDVLQGIRKSINSPNGIFIVSGPTGSGKSTTLYAFLNEVNTPDKNVVTLEDPVEYRMDSVNQGQANPKAGFTFASGLRSILRQDPDVIMVGEIRDQETAHIAMEASLTGHLVFSTLHTNSATESLTRLIDMGVEPFLVAAALQAVLAQRLARRICTECKEEVDPETIAAMLDKVGTIFCHGTAYRGAGCAKCGGTGYYGRVPVFEFLPINDPIRREILANSSATEIEAVAMQHGMQTLVIHGLSLVEKGLTTIEEVLRLCQIN